MNDDNQLARKLNFGICLSDSGIVPVGDLAEKDSGQDLRCELHIASDARHIVGRDIGAEHCRNVENVDSTLALEFGNLLIGHWPVARAEINRALGDLANASAAADGLVIDLNIGMG